MSGEGVGQGKAAIEGGGSPRVYEGQVWRRRGPRGWARVEHIVIGGFPAFDGGLPGVSILVFNEPKGRRKPRGQRWFVPSWSLAQFEKYMRGAFRYPESEHMDVLHQDALEENKRPHE
jgi:hypothetical protein